MFLVLIYLIFYVGLYRYILTAESSSLSVENTLHVALSHKEVNMIVLGDSTAAEGFRTNDFNSNKLGIKAANMAVPGTWFLSHHLLMDKVKYNKLDSVLVFIGPDEFIDSNNTRTVSDLEYHKTLLHFSDIIPVTLYSNSIDSLFTNYYKLLFRPVLYKRDLQDAIKNPLARLHLIKSDYFWLNRPISASDLFWEDNRDFNMCGIHNLDSINKQLENVKSSGNAEKIAQYSLVASAYNGRKDKKIIGSDVTKNLDTLIKSISKKYKRVYVVNAPENSTAGIYPANYLNAISAITKRTVESYNNAFYIPINPDIANNCSNYMDVVHLNVKGGKLFTNHIKNSIRKLL